MVVRGGQIEAAGPLLPDRAVSRRSGVLPWSRGGVVLRHSRPDLAEWRSRERWERWLQDGPALRLSTLALGLGQLAELSSDPRRWPVSYRDDELPASIPVLQKELQTALDELRELGAAILPPLLASHGLVVALEALAERLWLWVRVSGDSGRLPWPVEPVAYFAVAGLLETVSPGSSVTVHIRRRRRYAEVRVAQRSAEDPTVASSPDVGALPGRGGRPARRGAPWPPAMTWPWSTARRPGRCPADLVVRIPCG